MDILKNKRVSKTRIFVISLFAVLPMVIIFAQCSQQQNQEQVSEVKHTPLMERALSFTSPLPEDAFLEGMNRSDEIIELGKMLFFEPRLSRSGLISCHTCHNLATFGVDQLPISTGHKWQQGPINAPTVLNAALHKDQFWDGRAADVEEQAGMPILDMLEMAATEEHVISVLQSMPEYVERFSNVFSESEIPLVYENVGKAIGAFERILITKAPFDYFLQGDDKAITADQKAGLDLFIKTGCQACHRGAVLGGDMYAFFQTPKEIESGEFHLGRYNFTGRESDRHFFKVPTLRNITHTYPYLHDGSLWSLEETINVVAVDMLNKELQAEETRLIAAFLESLTGEIPNYALEIPILPASTALTPRPNMN